MNAKVRWAIDLSGIYIKEKVISGKIPTQVSAESSVVESASCCRTWGIGSHKNLMKAHLVCQSIRSVSWAAKKAFTQAEVMYDKHGLAMMTLESSFLLEEPEKRISKGYCRVLGLGAHIYVYIGLGAQSEDVKQFGDG